MEVVRILMVMWRETLSILNTLWLCAVRAMTWFTNTRKKAEKKGGSCECPNAVQFDPYNSAQCADAISVEMELCLMLAKLYDDPECNNFDCPWEWRKE